jgi:RNA polymerase sigma-70 factor (ECF subfamily)
VFLRLWERVAQYDEAFPLDAWLRRIATNRAIDFWRSRKAERRHLAASTDDDDAGLAEASPAPGSAAAGAADPEVRLGWRELQAIWDHLAADLPPQQRAAFVLRHIEGWDPAEVAEALGCSPSTVRSHISEARRTLRAALRARYPELVDDG